MKRELTIALTLVAGVLFVSSMTFTGVVLGVVLVLLAAIGTVDTLERGLGCRFRH
ncbi:hypothetical protein [Haloprofundus salinisoli]|uniref:hypothetical protein n=1 Tax=Haloprofundus salinisoli TaxID=2876193 RepID=UPI001CCB713B|nr:hypothetical protein [Haloprofundus salinisoli]